VLGVLLVALIGWAVFASLQKPMPRRTPSVAVAVAKVTTADVPVTVTALGAAQAWQGVTITPQVSGRLTFVAKEGDNVRAGALLVQIDCTPYQAALLQAQGQLRRDQATLAGAKVNLARYQTLVSQNSIARQTAEDEAATVKQDEGTVQTDQGAVAAAGVNVRYCRITSPVDGRIGVRLIDPGNVVSAGQAGGIISVNQIEPIAVTFTVPQGDFQRLVSASAGFSIPLETQATSQETGADLGTGELVVADNHVDPATGTVAMKARFPNATRQLWPGQFINVTLTLQTLRNALTVPAQAINQDPDPAKGPFVYLVGPDAKVSIQHVVVAATEGATAVLQSGLTPGQTVVTDGQMSLKAGLSVCYAGGPSCGPSGGPGSGPGSGPAGGGRGHHGRPAA
jgi:multidrug efflux system membrane fusion protein